MFDIVLRANGVSTFDVALADLLVTFTGRGRRWGRLRVIFA
jgi:hypothetical protein